MSQTSTAGGNRPSGFGGGGHGRGERLNIRTVYVLSGDAELKPARIKIGISDGIYTEVLDGLKEGDLVVAGTTLANTQTTSSSANPLGGGFPRMR